MTSRERDRSRSRIRSRVLVAVLIGSLVTLGFLGALLIPLYTYPGVSWTSIINAKDANPSVGMVAIINPDNGPGASIDQNYVTGIQNLRAAGVIVLGYDHTSYGARPLATVEADINTYKDWYNLSGIFFDEMSNVPGYENYYSTLNQYAKSVGFSFTVGNPGGAVPASYIGTMDVIVTYENQGVPDSESLAAMTNGVPANHFAVIAYGVNVWNGSAVSDVYNYASYVYVTNDTLPNPYGALTGDFSKLVTFLDSPFQSSVPITIDSVSASGTPIAGVYTVISSTNGVTVVSGDTPMTASVTRGSAYVVSVANYGNFVFEHWDDGSTSASQGVTLTGGTTLTATYGTKVPTTASLTIQSDDLTGAALAGLTTTVTSNGNAVATGVTPLTLTGTIGESYTVSIGNSAGYVLDDWGGGGTSTTQTVTLAQNTTLTAYFTAPASTSTGSTTSTTTTSPTSSTTTAPTTTTSSAPSTTTTASTSPTSSTTTATTTAPTTTASITTTITIPATTISTTSAASTSSTTGSTIASSSSTGPAISSSGSTSQSASTSTSIGYPALPSTVLPLLGVAVFVVAVVTVVTLLIRGRGSRSGSTWYR
jgi:hypothetical protein